MGRWVDTSFTRAFEAPVWTGVGTPGYYGFPGLVELSPGNLLITAMQATDEATTRNGRIVAKASSDGGATWGSQSIVADTAHDCRDSEIVKLSSGRLVCSFSEWQAGILDQAKVVYSDDNGGTWSNLVSVNNPLEWSFPTAKVVELSSGRLLLPMYGLFAGDTLTSGVVCYSDDDGVTWSELATILNGDDWGRNVEEPYICRDPANDRLWCGIRSDTGTPGTYLSSSFDEGVTWTTPVRLFNGSGRPAIHLSGQRILALDYRDTTASNVHGLRFSGDRGASWSGTSRVNSAALMSYGSWVTLASGKLGFAWSVEQSSTAGDVVYQEMNPPGELRLPQEVSARRPRAAAMSLGGGVTMSPSGSAF